LLLECRESPSASTTFMMVENSGLLPSSSALTMGALKSIGLSLLMLSFLHLWILMNNSETIEHRGCLIVVSMHRDDEDNWAGSFSITRDGKAVGIKDHQAVAFDRSYEAARSETLAMAKDLADLELDFPGAV
jgi:hypothetical protein